MKKIFKKIIRRYSKYRTKFSHGQIIEDLIKTQRILKDDKQIFVETGCGMSTLSLAKCANEKNAIAYSLDYNQDKIDELKTLLKEDSSKITFIAGDSLKNLKTICDKHVKIDFLFLDSAASAMHTFKEFQMCEDSLKEGSIVLIDNAALPKNKMLFNPVRKGKILVPYLLASPFWEVFSHPRAGDSMVSAIKHKKPKYSDFEYEYPEYIDHWRKQFENNS